MEHNIQVKKAKMLDNYLNLIESFQDAGYQFQKFSENISTHHSVLLRHDIDFDCELAYEMAIVESKKSIVSSYFFLLSNNSYNLLSKANMNYVKQISNLGHDISLHFDSSIYDDFQSGLNYEIEVFEKTFSVKINTISLHRPLKDFFGIQLLPNIQSTYEKRFFNDMSYFADSGGSWRYGSPVQSAEFFERKSMQILIHPIWWQIQGLNRDEKFLKYLVKHFDDFKNHCAENTIFFNDIKNLINVYK